MVRFFVSPLFLFRGDEVDEANASIADCFVLLLLAAVVVEVSVEPKSSANKNATIKIPYFI